MADTTTPVYSFVLPEPDGSDGTWGTKLNANLTALDGLLSGSTNLQNASFTGTASFGGSTGTAGQVLKSQGAGANAIWTDDSNTTYTAGSGLSLIGTEFANTAPDQTVVMNAGSGISVSGTYPTFTVTNSSPDQTVGLTGTGGTTISGTYPSFTINSTDANTTYTAGTGLTLTSTEFSVTDSGIGATQLNVSGNGTSGQFLASDGDGTFSWQTSGAGGNETLAQTLALGAVTGGTSISVSSGDNIIMAASSTVDGRDVSVDGTKLDGIATGATNVTNNNQLTNGAGYVTTDTNTTYTAGSGLSLTGTVFANTAPDQTVALTGSGATSISGTYPNFTISSTNTTYSVGDGGLTQINFTSADNTKLDGIETGATADQTAAQILTAIKTVDGSGSGLDADLLDGQQGSYYYPASNPNGYTSNVGDITGVTAGTGLTGGGTSGTPTLNVIGGSGITANANDIAVDSTVFRSTGDTMTGTLDLGTQNIAVDANKGFVNSGAWTRNATPNGYIDFGPANAGFAHIYTDRPSFYFNKQLDVNGARVWNSGNDGAGSGLDADLLDGLHESTFMRRSANSGLDMNNNAITDVEDIYLQDRIYHDGDTDTYIQFTAADQWRVVTGGTSRLEVSNTQVTVPGNMVVSGTLSVRTAIDLADSDILRFGSGDDTEFFCNGTHMYMDLNAGIGNFYIRDTTTTRFTFDDAGHFTATGNVTAYSDIRLKEDIKPIEDAVSKVQQITGNTYTRNDLKDADRRYGGVIAQEVEVVLPEAVNESEDGTKTVDYNALIALLVESVKELKAEIETLKGNA